jgi:uroporphyrinogen decarboxylase
MNTPVMTPMQRVLCTLGQREPDRVPLFLLTSLQGARELGLSLPEYYARAEHVVEGQLRLLHKFGGDCVTTLFSAAHELQAFGGELHWAVDGPATAGAPVLRCAADIDRLRPPRVARSPGLQTVLQATRALKARLGDTVPIIGVVVSPFSLPVMQMGFDHYLDLMHGESERFERLMRVNEDFCAEWANAQLAAGATAICYFDPVSSCTIIPPALYRRTGQRVAQRVLARIHGPTATHMASGRCAPIVGDIADTGTQLLGVSALEDLGQLKAAARGRLCLVGNLNGVEMRRWSPAQAEAEVRRAIAQGAPGGGFILSDNHGEIPLQVSDEVLLAIAEATRRWGHYPLSYPLSHPLSYPLSYPLNLTDPPVEPAHA